MLPTFTGWPSAFDSCAASALRTLSWVNTARAQKNRPITRTAAIRAAPTRAFFSIVFACLSDLIGRNPPRHERRRVLMSRDKAAGTRSRFRRATATPWPFFFCTRETAMTDEALVACFEAAEEPPGGFHHREHVRVAWWYLRQLPWTTALERFAAGLRRYAAARGAAQRYHETITTAYVLMVNERLDEDARHLSWEEFAGRNPDLLAWKP